MATEFDLTAAFEKVKIPLTFGLGVMVGSGSLFNGVAAGAIAFGGLIGWDYLKIDHKPDTPAL